ncbi:MAG: hypothetical protein NT126_04470 [Bacteroidetes bacterium]|nr:hypothetical protein [Bacteroidota bacterium]
MKKFIIIAIIVMGSGVAYAYYLFNKPHQGVSHKEAAYTMESRQLFNEYDQNENSANKKYLGKVVCVYGKVADKGVDSKGAMSLILEGGEMAGVGCQFDKIVMDDIKDVKKGQVIKVKGVCTGMLMDVVLVDCVPDDSN